MQLSTRNQLPGTVKSVALGGTEGDTVNVLIKATEVTLGK
jgi:molybdopterin-binding protein